MKINSVFLFDMLLLVAFLAVFGLVNGAVYFLLINYVLKRIEEML